MRIFIWFMLSCFLSISHGQSEFKEGKPSFLEFYRHAAIDFSEMNNGDIVLASYEEKFKQSKKKRQIVSVYNNLEIKTHVEIDFKKYGTIKKVLTKGDSIFLLTFHNDSKNKSLNHYLLSSHKDKLSFKKKILYTINKDQFKKYFMIGFGPILMNNGMNQMDKLLGYGDYIFSKNNEYFAIIYDLKNKNNQSNKIILFDKNFNLISETDYMSELKDKLFDMQKLLIDDTNGSIYFMGKAYLNNSSRKKKNGNVNYEYRVFKLEKNKEPISFALDLNKFIKDLEFIETGGELFLVGFYSNINENKQQGVYTSKIDRISFKQENVKVSPFNDKYIEKASLKYKRGKVLNNSDNDFVENYVVREFIKLKNEFYLISEVEGEEQSMSNGVAIPIDTYENISIIRLDEELAFIGSKIINRKFRGSFRFDLNKFFSFLIGHNEERISIYFVGQKYLAEGNVIYSGGDNMSTYEISLDSNFNMNEYSHKLYKFQTINSLVTENGIYTYLQSKNPSENIKRNLLYIKY
jgi:hypothetical protein